jgi:hypothetical protein
MTQQIVGKRAVSDVFGVPILTSDALESLSMEQNVTLETLRNVHLMAGGLGVQLFTSPALVLYVNTIAHNRWMIGRL